jgi:hypothetical protein
LPSPLAGITFSSSLIGISRGRRRSWSLAIWAVDWHASHSLGGGCTDGLRPQQSSSRWDFTPLWPDNTCRKMLLMFAFL